MLFNALFLTLCVLVVVGIVAATKILNSPGWQPEDKERLLKQGAEERTNALLWELLKDSDPEWLHEMGIGKPSYVLRREKEEAEQAKKEARLRLRQESDYNQCQDVVVCPYCWEINCKNHLPVITEAHLNALREAAERERKRLIKLRLGITKL